LFLQYNKDYDRAYDDMRKAQSLGFHGDPGLMKLLEKRGG
jgi:hypothetical protein